MALLLFFKTFNPSRHPRAPRGNRGKYAGGRFVPVAYGHPRLPFGPKNPAYRPGQAGLTAPAMVERPHKKANTSRLWLMETERTYNSKNYPMLVTREAIQNAVDAIKEAKRQGKLHRMGGEIEVTIDNDRQSVRVQDNGIGMDWDTLNNKFLELGATGKEDVPDQTGGFGVAKAVILGASKSDDWTIHSLNRVIHSHQMAAGPGEKVDEAEFEAPLVSGTDIEVRDIDRWDRDEYGNYAGAGASERYAREIMQVSAPETLGLRMLLNGQPVTSMFAGRRSVQLTNLEGDWGQGNSVEIRSYKRASGGSAKIYVRLNGLYQWARTLNDQTLPKDILIDVKTENKPGTANYPFTAGRDGFRSHAWYRYNNLVDYLQRETHSGDREMGWDDTYYAGKGGSMGGFGDVTPALMPSGRDYGRKQDPRNVDVNSGGEFQRALAPIEKKFEAIKKAAPYEDAGLPMLVRKNRKTYGNRRKFDPMEHVETYAGWNAITHMVATAYGMPRIALANFGAGFVLDPQVEAQAQNDPTTGRQYVAINPERVEEAIKRYRKKGQLWGLTNHLFSMACHELAHLQFMDGHSESFTVHREAISLETGHLLPALHQVVEAVWGGPVRKDIKTAKASDPAYQKVLEAARERAQAVHARQRVLKELTKRFGLPDVETLIERAQTDKRRLARMSPEDIRYHIERRMQ